MNRDRCWKPKKNDQEDPGRFKFLKRACAIKLFFGSQQDYIVPLWLSLKLYLGREKLPIRLAYAVDNVQAAWRQTSCYGVHEAVGGNPFYPFHCLFFTPLKL